MKVQLSRTFPIPASADAAWVLLQDIVGVAGCMPGAKITDRVDDTHFKGTVGIKVGPASLSFRGDIEVKGVDASARSLHLFAKGTDTTGSSAASMDLKARVEARDAASCNLVGDSEVSINGKAAGFGARLMGPVADQVLGQFAANFAARLQVAPVQAAPTQAPPLPAEEDPLNALGLAWAVIKSWLRSLFAGKSS